MADTWTRIRNVFSDEQDHSRQAVYEQGKQAATEQVRDQLLGSALAMRTEWTQTLAKDGGPNQATDQVFAARVRELDQALQSLREVNPAIQARLDPEEIRQAAHESLERQRTYEPGSQRRVLGTYEDLDRRRVEQPVLQRERLQERSREQEAGLSI